MAAVASPLVASTSLSCARLPARCSRQPRSTIATTFSAGLLCAALRNVNAGHLQRRGRRLAVRAVSQAVCDDLREELGEILADRSGVRRVPAVVQEAMDRLRSEADDFSSEASECLTLALEMLLEGKAYQAALQLYLDWNEVQVPVSLRVALMQLLGTFGNFQAAQSHVLQLIETEEVSSQEAAQLFDGILSGIVQSHHPLASSRADVLIKEMIAAGLQPTSETLRLLVEAKTIFAAPGFLIDLGQSVLEIIRQFETSLHSNTLLAITGAHLRTGDLDAAYRWFLASQLMADRQLLNDGPALELVSQLARALAIGGRACQLKRLLMRVKEDGGKLPSNSMAVSLSGYLCGRTLLTCWLEPPPEVIRRRSVWASTPSAQVTCAEQWDWQEQETSRQEMYQWYPYMSPETKLERAWMTPLRSIDRGALGLAKQWAGQTPAEASARERLEESEIQPFDLEASLSLEPPGTSARRGVQGSPVCLRPEPKSWRVYFAEAVKKAYPTSMRTRADSPEELRELLLAEKNTRLMFGAKPVAHPIPPSTIQEWVMDADAEMTSQLQGMEEAVKGMSKERLVELISKLSDMSAADIEEDPKLNPSRLRSIVLLAVKFVKGTTSIPLTDEEYHAKIMDMTDDELQEAFLKLKASINDSILGADLTKLVDEKLVDERMEDSNSWDGSAEDELRLALDISKAMQELGPYRPSRADRKALLVAAYALGQPQLAEEVLQMHQAPEPQEAAALGHAQEQLWKAMVSGGWESQSTKDFLQGKRLIPLRDESTELGKLQTKYLDPLMGLSSSHKADDLLKTLSKPFDQRIRPYRGRTVPPDASTRHDFMNIVKDADPLPSVQWEIKVPDPEVPGSKVTKQIKVTRRDVMESRVRFPSTSDLLLRLSSSPRLSKTSDVDLTKLLTEMDLPMPKRQDKKQELITFVLSVLRA